MLFLKIFLILVIFIITAVHSNLNLHLYISNSTNVGDLLKTLNTQSLNLQGAEYNDINTSSGDRLSNQLNKFMNLFTDLKTQQKMETKLQFDVMQNTLLEQRKEIKLLLRDMQQNLKDLKKQQKQQQISLTNVRNAIGKHSPIYQEITSEIDEVNREKDEENTDHENTDLENTDQENTDQENTENKGPYPYNCAEAVPKGGSSGIYTIQAPVVNAAPKNVYCLVDPDGGAAWTIIQRRQDGTVNFYRNWAEYKTGFGNLHGEYFIGLDLIHALTYFTKNELWIELQDFENVTKYAKYASFGIGNEMDGYKLYPLGDYNGNVFDSFKYHEGFKFTTYDNDNDDYSGNCATFNKGAWWYNKCHSCNLNGRYLHGNYSKEYNSEGIVWGNWHGFSYSLKYTHMAIRPIQLQQAGKVMPRSARPDVRWLLI